VTEIVILNAVKNLFYRYILLTEKLVWWKRFVEQMNSVACHSQPISVKNVNGIEIVSGYKILG
jgi:hypothetical protein